MTTTQYLLIATTLVVAGCDPGNQDTNPDIEESAEDRRNTSLMAEIADYDAELDILNEKRDLLDKNLKKAREDQEKEASPESTEKNRNSFTFVEEQLRALEDDIARVEKARGDLQKELGELK